MRWKPGEPPPLPVCRSRTGTRTRGSRPSPGYCLGLRGARVVFPKTSKRKKPPLTIPAADG